MATARLIAEPVSNTADAMNKISSVLVSAGWTVVDDQIGASEYIWWENGGGENSDELDVYFALDNSITTDRIIPKMATHWDSGTHTGTYELYYSSQSYLQVDDDNPFTIWVFANRDQVSIVSKISTSYYHCTFGMYERYWDKPLGILTSDVTAGSNVVLQLGAGEAADFEVGLTYTICENSTNSQERPTITVVDTVNDQITVDSLSQNWSSSARIGYFPFPYFGLGRMESSYSYGFSLEPDDTTATSRNTDTVNTIPLWSNTIGDPDDNIGFYVLIPMLIYDNSSNGAFGFSNEYWAWWRPDSTNSFEDTIEVGRLDTGTSTGTGNSSLTDTSKSWTVDEYQNKAVIITSGTGQGQMAKITSNTSDTLTFDTALNVSISTDSQYVICDEAWMGFMGSSYGWAFRAI